MVGVVWCGVVDRSTPLGLFGWFWDGVRFGVGLVGFLLGFWVGGLTFFKLKVY